MVSPEPARTSPALPKLLYLVTEDWYFCSHRLPVARAARAAGFAVAVATRVDRHGARIVEEGFALHPLGWRRRGDGVLGALRAIAEIARLYRAERPDIVHHVALKPVLFGALACRLAFPRGIAAPSEIAAVMGLGSGFTAGSLSARLRRPALGRALGHLARGGWAIVQNPEDCAALLALGLVPERVALIRGSGVDTYWFAPLPEPQDATVTVALVARMLREKGVCEAVAAVRQLRAQGLPVELLLAGPTDPDNPGSLTPQALAALAAEPGVTWLGPVDDVRSVWRRAAIALLPSTYGEGVPKTLLEAAACARPLIAADVPGCREVVRPGTTGLLVPPRDTAALAAAIAALAVDPARRRALGEAARALVTRDFAIPVVARDTLALYRTLLREREGR
ncbi:MAG TPA: glycosyltransferase family 4 protein [Stellaceae bacterium]|nr:glycosyltransferase family 4 protein [Stellaceae bacterium]